MKEGGLRLEDEVGKERKGKKVWFPSRAVERARVFGPVLQIRSLPSHSSYFWLVLGLGLPLK